MPDQPITTSATKPKRTLRATVAYPRHPLALCLALTAAVRDEGGNRKPVPKSILASRMKVAEGSEDFISKIASAKCFRLIEGRAEFSLTEGAKRYYYPPNDAAKRPAFISFLSQPEAFDELIKLYDGERLPEQQYISNRLHEQFGLPAAWASRVAGYFLRSAETVGVIDQSGFLRYHATMQSAQSGSPTP